MITPEMGNSMESATPSPTLTPLEEYLQLKNNEGQYIDQIVSATKANIGNLIRLGLKMSDITERLELRAKRKARTPKPDAPKATAKKKGATA